MDCKTDKQTVQLKPVPLAIKERVLSTARLGKKRYRWRPRFLARDPNALYYLVEELAGSSGTGFRLLRGARAQLKPVRTTRLAADPIGFIIVTKKGTLRYDTHPGRLAFTNSKGVAMALDMLNLRSKVVHRFLLNDLGPYHGVRFESPCEVIRPPAR
jgi:hypothetical protein